MRRFFVLGFFVLAACQPTKFRPHNGEKESAPAQNSMVSSPTPAPIPGIAKDCLERILPLRFMIVLDVSYSMKPALDDAKAGLKQIIATLKTIKPVGTSETLQDVQVGLVAFADNPAYRIQVSPTSDTNHLESELAKLRLIADVENEDGPEEAITAVSKSLDVLELTTANQEAVTSILLITDNFGHDGGAVESRNYNLDSVSARLQKNAFKHFFLYDVTPTTNPYEGWEDDSLPKFSSPAAQWEEARRSWHTFWDPSHSRNGGRGFGFPFLAQDMLTKIPQDISTSLKFCEKTK